MSLWRVKIVALMYPPVFNCTVKTGDARASRPEWLVKIELFEK